MNNLNSILVEGNLVRDPELTHTPKGTPVCKFAIATNRFFKLEDEFQKEVSFFEVTVWSKLANRCNEGLKKGRGVRIIGRLKQDRWKGINGQGKSRVYIIANNVEFKPLFSKEKETNQTRETEYKAAVSY
ncbi:MAG: single-stranded DNA-binding protein [Spirochaetales bacterium]|nr:single-stranded DNA-binding protein [Spirochaetales bacterium]